MTVRKTRMIPGWDSIESAPAGGDGLTIAIIGGGVHRFEGGQWVPVSLAGSGGGVQGPRGPAGPAGPAGSIGPEGPEGAQGPEGPEGPRGPQGPKGDKGDAGTSFVLQGSLENEGDLPNPSTVGHSYFVGVDLWVYGDDGWINAGPVAQGPEGPQGPQGEEGPMGPPGVGIQGPRGPQGPKGDPGPAGIGNGGGIDLRASYTPLPDYPAGSLVRFGSALYLAARHISGAVSSSPGNNAPYGGDAPPAPHIPAMLMRDVGATVTLETRAGIDLPPGAIVRTATAKRTAFLNYSSPTATSLNPAIATMRASRNGSLYSFDGLAMEFDIPHVPGAVPIGAHLGLRAVGPGTSGTISSFQLKEPLGASPTWNSVGPIQLNREGFVEQLRDRRPDLPYPVGIHQGAYANDFWDQGAAGTQAPSLRLGLDSGLPYAAPLDLSGTSITLLVTAQGGIGGGVESVSAHGSGQYAPQLTIEYLPAWIPIVPERPVLSAQTFTVDSLAVISRTSPTAQQKTPDAEGKILVAEGDVILLHTSSPMVVGAASRVTVNAQWITSLGSGNKARVVKGNTPMTGLTWNAVNDFVREAFRINPPSLPSVEVTDPPVPSWAVAIHLLSSSGGSIPASPAGVTITVA